MKKWKVGLIGAGNIARSAHMPVYQKHTDLVEVVAVADINLERAQEAAKLFGIPHAYSSVEELLANEDVDTLTFASGTVRMQRLPLLRQRREKRFFAKSRWQIVWSTRWKWKRL